MNPDSLMSRYWIERERRSRGEHTGLRAIAPTLSGIVSECCAAKVMPNRNAELVCTKCNGVCDGQSWMAAKAEAQQGDGIRTMFVRETRVVDGDQQARLRADEADRYLEFQRLAALIEPRPPAMQARRWRYVLHAYGWFLTLGPAIAELRGLICEPKLGPWSESSIRRAVEAGRDVLRQRADRPRTRAWVEVTRDRGSCAILH